MTFEEFICHIHTDRIPVQIDFIDDLEVEIEQGLPPDYRGFLQLCNGGFLHTKLQFHSGATLGRHTTVTLDMLGGDREHCWLTNYREMYWGRIPEALRWIGSDPFGNAFCIGVEAEHYGKIYFWDHEGELANGRDPTMESTTNVYLLAPSFEQFVGQLVPLSAATKS